MSIKDFFKYWFTEAPAFVDYKPEDWVVDDELWTRTHVEIPKIVHRGRLVKRVFTLKGAPWKLEAVREPGKMIVRYERTNYPLEPRIHFRVEFY